MAQVRKFGALGFVVVAAFLCIGLAAQAGDPGTLIQQKLVSQINMTKTTADRSDIVTAGDVLVLHKDGLMMCSTASSYAFSNTYNNGVLAANYKNRAKDAGKSYMKAFGLSKLGLGDGASAYRRGQQRLPVAEVCCWREVLGDRDCGSKGRNSGKHLQRSI